MNMRFFESAEQNTLHFFRTQETGRRTCRRITGKLYIPAAVLFTTVLFLLAALFVSCGDPYNFEEYRGVNLIPDAGFDAADTWNSIDSTYMAFSAADTSVSAPSDESDAAVYVLELKNLIPDGDFEAATVGDPPDYWANGASMPVEVINSGDYEISGNTLQMSGSISGSYCYYTLPTSILENNSSYSFFFSYIKSQASTMTVLYPDSNANENYRWDLSDTINIDNTMSYPESGTSTSFIYSSSTGSTLTYDYSAAFYLDNFRLIRNDIDMDLTASFTVDSTAEPLVDGAYEFSVYVKAEGTAGESLGSNRFACQGVTLSMYMVDSAGDPAAMGGDSVTGYFTAGIDFTEDEWTQISIKHGTGESFQFDDGTWGADSYILVLAVSPTNLTGSQPDIGSVLIAAPRLELLPDN